LTAVAVNEGEARKGLTRQHGFDDRQNRRDTATACNAQVMPCLGRINRYKKTSFGGQNIYGIARLQTLIYPTRYHTATDMAHANAQLAIVHA
jgi:hypothetical protein